MGEYDSSPEYGRPNEWDGLRADSGFDSRRSDYIYHSSPEDGSTDVEDNQPPDFNEYYTGLGQREPQTSKGYIDALRAGQQVELSADSPLRGRILRGREETDFEILGSEERDIVFIMGPDGLAALPGVDPLAALDRIGLTPDYVQGRIAQGHMFRLMVFEGGSEAPLATWDNALDMVAANHPELAADIALHRAALKTTPFEVFQADVDQPLDDIELAGPAHPEYMSLERYVALPPEARENPAKLRRLLFHKEHLGSLFYGDGYTRTPDGQIGLREYLVPNGRIDQLPGVRVTDLL
ncbi:MAG TPA: hypothetical protein VFT16_03585 [Candidatus Saccharimonadales bacterium]|nr:hypothetical protein [Candidatus Saccharimonadales bacterium]